MRHRSPSSAAALVVLLACGDTPFRTVEIDLIPTNGERTDSGPGAKKTLRFSVAAIQSPRDTYRAYSLLFEKLGNRLGMEVEFIQRQTYREVNDLLVSGRLDAALVCTGGYLDLVRRSPGSVELLAVPVIGGSSTYESLVIVPAGSAATRIEDLEGKRFAFTDELSLSGRAYLLSELKRLGRNPESFFGSITYTHAHDRSIAAVARGLVDGASVHSHVFAHLAGRDPGLGKRVRVIHRSIPFGMEPVVVSTRLPPEERQRLRRVLFDLSRDPDGGASLETLQIDGFAEPSPGLYDSSARIFGMKP